jgi:hypothetical protein
MMNQKVSKDNAPKKVLVVDPNNIPDSMRPQRFRLYEGFIEPRKAADEEKAEKAKRGK